MRIYRASSMGYSLCSLVCGELGYQAIDPPEWLQKAFDEGKEIEPKVIEKLRDRGWYITETQAEINAVGDNQIEVEIEVIPGKAIVRGHLDGRIKEGLAGDTFVRNCVLEVKSMAAKSWKEFEDKGWDAPGIVQKYKWQCSLYGLAEQAPVVMVAWNKDTEELAFATMVEPFYTISDIALKIQAAEDHINAGTIPENCTDWPCPYFYLHGASDAAPVEQADTELDALLSAWMVADKAVKAYEGERKALRELIVEYAGETIAGKIKGSQGVVVSTTWVDETPVNYTKKAHWETRVNAPRKGRNVAE